MHYLNKNKKCKYNKTDQANWKLTSKCYSIYLSFLKSFALVIQTWSQLVLWKKAI